MQHNNITTNIAAENTTQIDFSIPVGQESGHGLFGLSAIKVLARARFSSGEGYASKHMHLLAEISSL